MNKSFTLIELLVVIVIIGILAGVIVVSTSSSISKANITKLKVFENTVQSELGANMVSRWKLDETSGIVISDSWGSNTGTLGDGETSSTYPTSKLESECVTGKCMYFDGMNDYIIMSNGIKDSVLFSVSGWINLDVDQNTKTIISNQTSNSNSWVVGISDVTPNKLKFYLSNGTLYSNTVFSKGVWYHFLVTYNNGVSKIYINGLFESTSSNSIYTSGTYLDNAIGCLYRVSGKSQYFNGLIDDVRIYDAALSTSQIKEQYIAGLNSLLAKNNISKKEYDERLNNLSLSK